LLLYSADQNCAAFGVDSQKLARDNAAAATFAERLLMHPMEGPPLGLELKDNEAPAVATDDNVIDGPACDTSLLR
jgi:hypothetical protein